MKKSLLQVLTLALCLINLVLTGLLIFTCMPAISKTASLVDKVCEIIDLDVTGATGTAGIKDVKDLEEVAIKFNGENTVSLNLKEGVDGKGHIIKFGVSIVLDKTHSDYKAMQPTVATANNQMASIIIDVVTKYTMEQANNNKEEKNTLTLELNNYTLNIKAELFSLNSDAK